MHESKTENLMNDETGQEMRKNERTNEEEKKHIVTKIAMKRLRSLF